MTETTNPCLEIKIENTSECILGKGVKEIKSLEENKFPYHPKGCFYAAEEARKKGSSTRYIIN
jgi:hypothetical protein